MLHPSIISFPDPAEAEPNGLLAVGGDLSVERLLAAYRAGIFPWYSEDEPILWFSPDPRMVLAPADIHLSRSLERRVRSGVYALSVDRDFDAVVDACALVERPGQDGTWITDDMRGAYRSLHDHGHAHSLEVWSEGELVGGLYGVLVGACFCGESMFSLAPDASKVAFVELARRGAAAGLQLIDCQLPTDHLTTLGAAPTPRAEFLARLSAAVDVDVAGMWTPETEGR
jgi:leucyl/phenylalanyl-tRNA--protein transferase